MISIKFISISYWDIVFTFVLDLMKIEKKIFYFEWRTFSTKMS